MCALRKPVDWKVLLIGGHSGTGKTAVARQLGRRWEFPFAEVDDFRLVLQRMTSPKVLPALHAFKTWSDVEGLPAEDVCRRLITIGQVVSHALEIVVANHVATDMPLILEGDGLVPSMAAQTRFANLAIAGPEVRAIFLVEPDRERLLESMRDRPRGDFAALSHPEQRRRASVSCLYGKWLKAEAQRHNLSVIRPQPWNTLTRRVLEQVGDEQAAR